MLHDIGTLQYDTAAGVLRRGLAEILEEGGVGEGFIDAARVLDVLGGELNDGTGLDVTLGSDVMTDAG